MAKSGLLMLFLKLWFVLCLVVHAVSDFYFMNFYFAYSGVIRLAVAATNCIKLNRLLQVSVVLNQYKHRGCNRKHF